MERVFELDDEIIIVSKTEAELWINNICLTITPITNMNQKCDELLKRGYREI